MADIATLVQWYLTIPSKPKRLNFYTVLGLNELIDDRAAIALAVEAAIEKLKSADRTSDPAGFEQVVKVVRQARATLLDEEKKRAYDVQLKSSLAKKPVTAEASTPLSTESSTLSSLFPRGDPNAPFSMSDFLKRPVEHSETETAAERHVAIAELVKNSQPRAQDASSPSAGEANGEQISSSNASLLNPERSIGGRNAGRELKEMIRRNRRKKNLFTTSIAVGGSLVVVLIGVWMFVSNRMEHNRRMAKSPNGPSLANVFQPTATDSDASTEPTSVENDVSDATTKRRMNLGVTPQSSNEKLGTLPKLDMEDQASMVPVESTDVAVSQPEPTPQEPMKTPEVTVTSKMVDDPPKSEDGNASTGNWAETMTVARKMLELKDFEKFGIEIEKALNLSKTDVQEEQARRLDKFGQLYEKGLTAANEAFATLKGTDEIKYGSAGGKASVVESSDNLLILRISGKNEKFSYDKIPMGIVMAVLEPKLNDDAMDHAIRGILLSIDSRSNSANKKQAKVHFEKAASMDEEFAKLELVLEEKYQ